jgi:hypothetical protein
MTGYSEVTCAHVFGLPPLPELTINLPTSLRHRTEGCLDPRIRWGIESAYE